MPLGLTESFTHGAVLLDSQLTRFALWAPDAYFVSVELADGRSLAMLSSNSGWFTLEVACGAGTQYRFNVDGEMSVPDPASRSQVDDVKGFSQVVDPRAYAWQQDAWLGRPWHEAVIYELHVGALGGYVGVTEQLPRLAQLGVTAIELMPIAQFPGERNWGYDGVLPYAPQSSYGTPEQLKHLIDTAHQHGLMVLLDVVYNHFGPDGNYLGSYAKGFFDESKHTPWGAAIDFTRREVRDFYIDNALMWLLEYRFDGLRFDAVHAIEDQTFLPELAQRIREQVDPARHVWLNLENEHNRATLLDQDFDAQWNDDGHNVLHVLLTGETDAYYRDFAHDSTAKLARCLSEGFIYQGENHRHGHSRGESSGHLPPTAFVLFLQNHDQIGNRAFGERLAQLCSEDALRAATGLLLLAPMIPLMFMGDEWAAKEPFLFFTDFHGELADAVRNGRREEFKEFAAFEDETQREKIPDPNEASTFNACTPNVADASSGRHQRFLTLYQQLLVVRRERIMPLLPGCRALGAEVLADAAVSARWQLGDGSMLRIDLNLSANPVEFVPPHAAESLFESQTGAAQAQAQGRLAPHTCVVTVTAPVLSTLEPVDE